MLKNLSEVNISIPEGRLFMAALSKLTTLCQSEITPDEVLEQCASLAAHMYKDMDLRPNPANIERPGFAKELESLINRYSMESGSNSPDYILAEYLTNSLNNFHLATRHRDNWYGGKRSVINDQAEMWDVEPVK